MKIATKNSPISVPGFRFAGIACGLKQSGKRDVALIVSDVPAVAVGAFTTNLVKGAPVLLSSERVRRGRAQAILVNSGNANTYTGRRGYDVARELCRLAARHLGIREDLVLPASTGRIGVQLPKALVAKGVVAACRDLSADGFHRALEGIMTTDAFPKFGVERVLVDGTEVTIAGMAKGAGMIAPKMEIAAPHATMLSYILTDARVSPAALKQALGIGLAQSYNCIVVDGDTSTSDTLGGRHPHPPRPHGAGCREGRGCDRALASLQGRLLRRRPLRRSRRLRRRLQRRHFRPAEARRLRRRHLRRPPR
jgi:glutamate N-acetyltransferase / amino-acid N-acetyltransferase